MTLKVNVHNWRVTKKKVMCEFCSKETLENNSILTVDGHDITYLKEL